MLGISFTIDSAIERVATFLDGLDGLGRPGRNTSTMGCSMPITRLGVARRQLAMPKSFFHNTSLVVNTSISCSSTVCIPKSYLPLTKRGGLSPFQIPDRFTSRMNMLLPAKTATESFMSMPQRLLPS